MTNALTKDEQLSKWGRGPWLSEPDHEEWRHNGIPCIAHRHPSSGHWCGYIAVEPGHPWDPRANPKTVDYGDGEVWADSGYRAAEEEACVHWGITFGGVCDVIPGVCHVPGPGESDDVYWLGFDCAHCDDISPSSARYRSSYHGAQYRTLEYVRAETERLADQAIARRSGPLEESRS